MPASAADAAVFVRMQQDETAAWMAAFVPTRSTEESAEHWRSLIANPRVLVHSIVLDGETVGYLGSFDSGADREVTYWLDRRYWGQGITAAALETFLGVETTRPLFARVARDNTGSVRVLEKCGFVLTGQTAGYAERRNAEIDELIYRLE